MKNSDYNKRDFYSEKEIASTYDVFRYGSKSGKHVNKRELQTVVDLIPKQGKIIDLPCGTGRFLKFLESKNYEKHGGDYSQSMLDTINEPSFQLFQLDAFNINLPKETYDIAVSLRFIFHYPEIESYIRGINRILKTNGIFICQHYRWSPLAWNIPVPYKVGGKIYCHTDKFLKTLFQQNGFEIIEQKSIFLFSPFAYKFLPFFVVRILDMIEKIIPLKWRVDNYFKLRKIKNIE